MTLGAPESKRCNACGEVKPLEGFSVARRNKDGRQTVCKPCQVAKSKAWREANPVRRKAQRRRYSARHAEREREWTRRWRAENREKKRAQQLLYRAVRGGQIERPASCAKCDAEGTIQAHHADYSRPLDVEWLCVRCHQRLHAEQRKAETR